MVHVRSSKKRRLIRRIVQPIHSDMYNIRMLVHLYHLHRLPDARKFRVYQYTSEYFKSLNVKGFLAQFLFGTKILNQ